LAAGRDTAAERGGVDGRHGDNGLEKITSDGMHASLASSSLLLILKKTPNTFFCLGASFLSEFKNFIQKEEMFEL
jgi:hypothetical protein